MPRGDAAIAADARDYRLDEAGLRRRLRNTALVPAVDRLIDAVERARPLRHGDLPRWREALARLPVPSSPRLDVRDGVVVGRDASGPDGDEADALAHDADSDAEDDHADARGALRALRPWRKGPLELHGVRIDTEWRSDLKWNRLEDVIEPLDGRCVLDVGSGSGYHLWRMHEAGAAAVIGIEPMLLYGAQFEAVSRFAPDAPVVQLPLRLEQLPGELRFDTVFSMGVLYHARDPHDHLDRLRSHVVPGGELVLETLVVDRPGETLLETPDRYAGMRNVFGLPTPALVIRWLERAGFSSVRTVSLAPTRLAEQRATGWSGARSLVDALDADDPTRTVEGLPAPCRLIALAN